MASNFSQESLRLFHEACEKSILADIRRFVKNGYPVNSHADSSFGEEFAGYTPLHFAARNEDRWVADCLLENADLSARDNKGRTALYVAVEKNFLSVIMLLLKNGASIHEPDNENVTPFDLALKNKQYSAVEAMISQDKKQNGNSVSFSDIFDIADFRETFHQRSLYDIEAFLKQGFSANSRVGAICEERLLHWAVINNNTVILELLLENGADITLKNDQGWTPVHLAYSQGSEDFIKTMFYYSKVNTYVNVADKRGLTHFHICCASHVPDHILYKFITSGTDINSSTPLISNFDYSGYTPLHFAIDDPLCVQWLLGMGADSSLTCEGGLTPLHLACERGAIDSAEFLIDFGANVMARDNLDRLPLHCAFYENPKSDLVDVLLKKVPTDQNYADFQKLSLLHIASARHNMFIVKRLLVQGCCPNKRTIAINDNKKKDGFGMTIFKMKKLIDDPLYLTGLTPLHLALMTKSFHIVKELLLAGADINVEGPRGCSTLSYLYNPSESLCLKFDRTFCSDYNTRRIDRVIENHIKKLDTAGLYVSKNAKEEFYGRSIKGVRPDSDVEQLIDDTTCLAELEKLRCKKIEGCADGILRTIVSNSEARMCGFVKNTKSTIVFNPAYLKKLEEEFPLYGFMIKAKVNGALRKIAMIQNAKASLKRLTGFDLPDLCYESIFHYLEIGNLENLILANIVLRKKDSVVSNENSRKSKKRKRCK